MATYPKGIGNEQEALQATAAMRSEPWYAALLKSWGLDPKGDANGNVKLSDAQQQQVLQTAQQHGVGINEDDFHVDENGQIAKNDSHWLRNTLIAAGVGGSMLIPGVGPAVLAGLGHVGSTLGTIGSGLAHGAAGAVGAGGAAGGGGSTLGTISSILGAAGPAIGAATQASGNNRLNQENEGLTANGQNITGTRSDVLNQLDVAKANATMENQHLKDQFALEMAKNPRRSPFNPTMHVMSPEYMAALTERANTVKDPLAKPTPYAPIDIKNVQGATGTEKGTLETIGDWLSPSLSIASKIPFGRGGSNRIPASNFYD